MSQFTKERYHDLEQIYAVTSRERFVRIATLAALIVVAVVAGFVVMPAPTHAAHQISMKANP